MYARGETWGPCETEPVETKLYASFNYGENVYFRLRSWNAREIIQPAWNKHELIFQSDGCAMEDCFLIDLG